MIKVGPVVGFAEVEGEDKVIVMVVGFLVVCVVLSIEGLEK